MCWSCQQGLGATCVCWGRAEESAAPDPGSAQQNLTKPRWFVNGKGFHPVGKKCKRGIDGSAKMGVGKGVKINPIV